MTTAIQTVDELILESRDQTDETATTDLSDDYFLRALNRGLQKLVRLGGRKYEAYFRDETEITPNSDRELEIPESATGLIVDQLQVRKNNQWYRVDLVDLRELEAYENDSVSSSLPLYAAQQGNKLKVFPLPTGSEVFRVRYQKRPPKLVKEQGRITNIDTANGILTLDAFGSDLTTDISALKAFVNVIDSSTGTIKGTYQVADLNTTELELTIKTTGLARSTVFGRTVSTSLSTDISQDDYVCIANGTCVPYLIADYTDYLVAYAVVEATRKGRLDGKSEYAHLKELEEDIRLLWAGRQAGKRVARKNPYWGRRVPLLYRYQ